MVAISWDCAGDDPSPGVGISGGYIIVVDIDLEVINSISSPSTNPKSQIRMNYKSMSHTV